MRAKDVPLDQLSGALENELDMLENGITSLVSMLDTSLAYVQKVLVCEICTYIIRPILSISLCVFCIFMSAHGNCACACACVCNGG